MKYLGELAGGRWVGLVLAGLLLASPLGGAQQPRKPAGDTLRLNAKPLDGTQRKEFTALFNGSQVVDASHKALLQQQAQYLVYRVTWDEYKLKKFQTESSTSTETMKNVLDEAFRNILVPTAKKPLSENQLKFMREFGKAMVAAIKEVLNNEMAIARVNAAII